MNGNLVDTNVIIKMLNGDPEAIRIFDSLDNIYISVITAGELYYGFFIIGDKDLFVHYR